MRDKPKLIPAAAQLVTEQKYLPGRPGNPPIPAPDLDGIDFTALTAWQRRVVLAAKGWITRINLSASGGRDAFYLSVATKHQNWHGTLCEVTTGAVRRVGVAPWADLPALRLAFAEAMTEAFDNALRLWDECRDFVPMHNARGDIVEDTLATPYFRKFPDGVVKPERALATESLPGWPDQIRMADFLAADADPGEAAIAEVLRLGQDWEDTFSPHNSRSSAWLNQGRRWNLGTHIIMTRWNDVRVDPTKARPLERYSSDLSSFGAAQIARDVCETLRFWQRTYSAPGALPPACVPHVMPAPAAEHEADETMPEPQQP